jgi:copper chaperone CopZ
VRDVEFLVAEAGCESCATRVRAAVETLVSVTSISIDEGGDTARVTGRTASDVTSEALDEVLAVASEGAGHRYHVVPGSLT